MKIVLVSPIPPPEGGIATWTKSFISYCKSLDVDISLVNTALIGARGKKINTKTTIHDEIKRTRNILKSLHLAVKDGNTNMVHINSSCSKTGILRDYLCVRIAKKYKVPVVFHCHCNVRDWINGKISPKIFKRIFIKVSKVIVLNKNSFNYVSELIGVDPIIVPNFIRTELLNDERVISKSIKKLVFIGHVQKSKGSIEIIESAKEFPQKQFVLVGPVEDEIMSANIPDNVILTGAKSSSEVQTYLKEADVFLFPSYTEGFSLALTEAMASGLPCIATDVGANRDMLEDNGGIIIQTKDVNAIIEAIKNMESYGIRKNMSLWNINKVKNNYVIDKVIETIIDIYNKT